MQLYACARQDRIKNYYYSLENTTRTPQKSAVRQPHCRLNFPFVATLVLGIMTRIVATFLALLCGVFGVTVDPSSIKYVHVVVMNHLDVGFSVPSGSGSAYSPDIVNLYFDHYFPLALEISSELEKNETSEARLIYTTHPWLIALYLDCNSSGFPYVPALNTSIHCPSEYQVAQFKKAIFRGVIAWHAFPFNAQSEIYDLSLFQSALRVSERLSEMFNITKPRTMSQKDVPGLTRSVIPILKNNNIHSIHIGVNGASAPPGLNDGVSIWRDENSGQDIFLLLHKGGYGGSSIEDAVMVPGMDRALIVYVRSDNSGPGSSQEITTLFEQQKANFPNAQVMASTYDDFTQHLNDHRQNMQTFTEEIGDTWIYGVPSDPYKVAAFRGIMRVRGECVKSMECDIEDESFIRFDRLLMKIGEHTWGLDVKTYLHDFKNWSNIDFDNAKSGDNYQVVVNSWIDQRSYLYAAIKVLGNHPVVRLIEKEISELKTKKPTSLGWRRIKEPTQEQWIGKFSISFSKDGSIVHLLDTVSGKIYADLSHKLGGIRYDTYDSDDYDHYLKTYPYVPGSWWLPGDFGKPDVSLGKAVHSTSRPRLEEMYKKGNQLWMRLSMNNSVHLNAGAPTEIYSTVSIGGNSTHGTIYIRTQWFDKRPTRLPESFWISFNPRSQQGDKPNWKIEKLGSMVSPLNIILNGSQHLHASTKGAILDSFSIESSDAAVISPGDPTPFPIPLDRVTGLEEEGISFCLVNNIWGTNYVMWYPFEEKDRESVFRFKMTVDRT